MDDMIGKQILEEIQKQSRMNRIFLIVFVLFIGFSATRMMGLAKTHATPPSPPSWPQVKSALDRDDYPKALQITQMLIGGRTDDHYGEEYLGIIYHLQGNLEKAEAHLARAYELFPSEEYEKKLVALRKALEFKNRTAVK